MAQAERAVGASQRGGGSLVAIVAEKFGWFQKETKITIWRNAPRILIPCGVVGRSIT